MEREMKLTRPNIAMLPLEKLSTILPHFDTEVRTHFAMPLKSIGKLQAGGNNQIYVAQLVDQPQKILIKKYYNDSIARLDREFNAFTFFKSVNTGLSKQVPEAFWTNRQDNYAVYSFEEGTHKTGNQITKGNLRLIVDFIVELQALKPDKIATHFDRAVKSPTSLDSYVHEAQWRIEAFQAAAAKGGVDERVMTQVSQLQAEKRLASFLSDFRKLHSKKELSAVFPPKEARLNPMDFSLLSILFRQNRPPCFVDFEYFGWDDPLHIVAEFLQHDRSQGLSKDLQTTFLDYYKEATNTSDATLQRLPPTIAILGAIWAARHLYFLTDEKMEPRRHAAAHHFNAEAYIEEQLTKLETRLSTLSDCL
jgi:hypothetical protein